MVTFFGYYCQKVIYICEIIIYLMVLIKSISGIRGTIHENDTEGLSPTQIRKCITVSTLVDSVKIDEFYSDFGQI